MLSRNFGIPVVVAVNRFKDDTPAEIELVRKLAKAAGAMDRRPGLDATRSVLLEQVLAYYDEFLAQRSGDPAVRHEAARTAQAVSAIRHSSNRLDAALDAARRSGALLDGLLAATPDDPVRQPVRPG